MNQPNYLDIWSFVIAIISLCVSIWIGFSAQKLSKKQARDESKTSEKTFAVIKETNEILRNFQILVELNFKNWTKESSDKDSFS